MRQYGVCVSKYMCVCVHLSVYKYKYTHNLPSQNSFPTHLLLNRCFLFQFIWLLLALCG